MDIYCPCKKLFFRRMYPGKNLLKNFSILFLLPFPIPDKKEPTPVHCRLQALFSDPIAIHSKPIVGPHKPVFLRFIHCAEIDRRVIPGIQSLPSP